MSSHLVHSNESHVEELELSIQGMSCSACAIRIEKSLGKIEGVKNVAVSYPLRKAWVHWDHSQGSSEKVSHKISQIGFQVTSSLHPHQDLKTEQRVLLHRLIWAVIITLPLLSNMLEHIPLLSFLAQDLPKWLTSPLVQLGLATIVQFVIGLPFYINAYYAIREKLANMDVLVAMGTTSAYLYSHYEVFSNGLEGLLYTYHQAAPNLYFETSAVVITIVLLGKWIETSAFLKMKQENDGFSRVTASHAKVERNGFIQKLRTEYIRTGDIVHVSAMEWVPVDGKVISGNGIVNESLLTGESNVIVKGEGDLIWAGTELQQGDLVIQTTTVGHGTMLHRIKELVKQGQQTKSNIQRQADRVSAWFVPILLIIALATCLIWGVTDAWVQGVKNAMAVLLVACPCALGLAAPISLSIASGKLAKAGLIVKEASAIERMATINHLVLDKTGTLTVGKPSITFIHPFFHTKEKIISILYSLERDQSHHIAAAVIQEAERHTIQPMEEATDVKHHAGRGVEGIISNRRYLFGSESFMVEQNKTIPSHVKRYCQQRSTEGQSMQYLFEDYYCIAVIGLADELKDTASGLIKGLVKLGVQPILATGDHEGPAISVARQIGIKQIQSSLTPMQKLNFIQQLKKSGKRVAMAGDGWNDAPALAASDVGITMSNGTEAALNAGHMSLLYSKLTSIASAIAMSRKTISNIKQNLTFAFIYNFIMIPFAAVGLLQPWMAGCAMALSSVCVVFNSLRLHRKLKGSEMEGG